MDPDKHRRIASMGGKAAHVQGRAQRAHAIAIQAHQQHADSKQARGSRAFPIPCSARPGILHTRGAQRPGARLTWS
jgi:Stress-induced bacterial acidophilic repeat motif